MSFEPITTQEALDSIIKERLTREKEKSETKIADYAEIKSKNEEYQKQIADFQKQLAELSEKDKTIEELTASNAKFENEAKKSNLVYESGLPYGSQKYITGKDEEEIKKSIADFQAFFKPTTRPTPLANPEPIITEKGKSAASNKEMLAKLKGSN